jgi:hypothetical protein
VNIDPDRIYHLDALGKIQHLLLGEQRWLKQLEGDAADGYTHAAKEVERQKAIVESLRDLLDGARERRMLATCRWVLNGAAAARVADKEKYSWAGLPEEKATAVRAAIDAGKVLRTAHRAARYGVDTDLRMTEFTDPELGQRWAVLVTMGRSERYLTDHPTRFDADTRFDGLLTAAGG